jgi:hypothetical protein
MSTPLPGPSVMMNRTGLLGHASAAADGPDMIGDNARKAAIRLDRAHLGLTVLLMVPPRAGRPFNK